MKQENINRILDLGIEILSKKGFHQLGLKELLDQAGIPKGSFYYYFKSKDDFGQKVISRYADNSKSYLELVLLDQNQSPRERLLTLFNENAKAYEEYDFKEGCLMGDCSNELGGQYNGFQLLLDQKFNEWSGVIKKCIEEGQEIGEFNNELDAEELAEFILNSWEGALTRMKASRSIKPFELFINYALNVVLKP